MSERVAMEDEFGRDAEEDFFAQEDMEDLVGAFGIDFHVGEDFFYGGDGQAGFGEGGFDLRFGGGFVGVEADGGAGRLYVFAVDVDFFGGGEFGESGTKCFGAYEAAEAGAEIFAGDSGGERIGAMELFDAGEDFFASVVVERGGDEEERVGDVFGAVGGD